MDSFEQLLEPCLGPLERFVRFRMTGHEADTEDLIQEVLMTAYQRLYSLRDPERFKPWIIQIARNKCRDYYRRAGDETVVPLEAAENAVTVGDCGTVEPVQETLESLREQDRQILRMTYYEELSQAEIASRMNIPVGTVKSRLYTAKQNFRTAYPYPPGLRGDFSMKLFPEKMPVYTITASAEVPFSVRWEEVMGWFIVPRLGESLRWAMYEYPTRKRTTWTELQVQGRMQVHGVQGVEIRVLEHNPVPSEQIGAQNPVERTLVAQLTDTHCRVLSEIHTHHGVKEVYTFLDGDEFLSNWGFGLDNCGNPIQLRQRGIFQKTRDGFQMADTDWPLDIVGRYAVTIGEKCYDTICVMDVSCYDSGVVSETYLDANGRTILWRRYNRDDWAFHHFGQRWTEKLPDNERLSINGDIYVHWYDIITDYVL